METQTWPQLLAKTAAKPKNMHAWYDRQTVLDEQAAICMYICVCKGRGGVHVCAYVCARRVCVRVWGVWGGVGGGGGVCVCVVQRAPCGRPCVFAHTYTHTCARAQVKKEAKARKEKEEKEKSEREAAEREAKEKADKGKKAAGEEEDGAAATPPPPPPPDGESPPPPPPPPADDGEPKANKKKAKKAKKAKKEKGAKKEEL